MTLLQLLKEIRDMGPVGERLYGSLALAALAMTKGASILRVHDVAETVDVVRMIAAVQNAE